MDRSYLFEAWCKQGTFPPSSAENWPKSQVTMSTLMYLTIDVLRYRYLADLGRLTGLKDLSIIPVGEWRTHVFSSKPLDLNKSFLVSDQSILEPKPILPVLPSEFSNGFSMVFHGFPRVFL